MCNSDMNGGELTKGIMWMCTLTWSRFASIGICVILCYWQGMFAQVSSFNGDISSWDVSKVMNMAVSMDGVDVCDMNGSKLIKVDET